MREVGRAEHASTEQLSALLDGRAEPDELVFLAEHVEQCVVCSHEMADLRSVRDLLRALPVYLPPRSFTIPIPVEPAPPPRRFRRLIPLTRALGTVAAVLCVVLFSVDAMQTGYDAPTSVADGGAGAMHLTTRATSEAAQDARPAPESEQSADAVPKIANAPAAPPAPAAKPAAALAPAATRAPFSTPIQSIANTVTATPAGGLARPAESAARAADTATSGRAESAASQAAPPPPAAAAAAPPTAVPGAPPQPAAAAAPAQPAGAAAPPPPAPTVVPAPAQRPPTPSPWLSPIRLWSLAFALIAAALLVASLVLSRLSRRRSGPSDEWSQP